MQDHRTQLATLIASRICHDLISPVGAISNGLELVSLGGAMSDGPELTLITESCENASARIKFFRVAYGAAHDSAQIAAAEIRSILDGMMRGTRLSVVWVGDADVSRADVQIAFLALQCLETALRRGGTITVTPGLGRIELVAEADRITPDPALWPYLDGPVNGASVLGDGLGIAPAHVQFALLPLVAADRGRRPSHSLNGSQMTLVV